MTTLTLAAGVRPRDRFEAAALAGLLAFVAALQISIAASSILLALTLGAWGLSTLISRQPWSVPRWFWPLLVYAALTLVSSAFSQDPRTSFVDSKQLVVFLLVPAVYDLARGSRARTVLAVAITVGAASAAFGIVQYGILNYDNLSLRPQGALGHYMTYSGLLLLVICAAVARLLYEPRNRTWPAVVMPALVAALVLSFTRSAWVGTAVAVAMLLALKDLRLLTVLPVAVAIFFVLAPDSLTDRFHSMFDLKDPTNRDRLAMLREGRAMVAAHPLTGVGPNMVERVYADYRDPAAVEKVNPHLHNVPVQIAAERGLPALAAWTWFVVSLTAGAWRRYRAGRFRFLSAAALAAVAGMLAAGLFEYNFGDSEFLMLFLVIVTLPFAAERSDLP